MSDEVDRLRAALKEIAAISYTTFTGGYPNNFAGADANSYRNTLRRIRHIAKNTTNE